MDPRAAWRCGVTSRGRGSRGGSSRNAGPWGPGGLARARRWAHPWARCLSGAGLLSNEPILALRARNVGIHPHLLQASLRSILTKSLGGHLPFWSFPVLAPSMLGLLYRAAQGIVLYSRASDVFFPIPETVYRGRGGGVLCAANHPVSDEGHYVNRCEPFGISYVFSCS